MFPDIYLYHITLHDLEDEDDNGNGIDDDEEDLDGDGIANKGDYYLLLLLHFSSEPST